MNRKILLLEPNYHNKYPPMSLMKLAMYYRLQKDQVVFYKGDLNAFVLSEFVHDAIEKLKELDSEYETEINWCKYTPDISMYLRSGKCEPDSEFEKCIEANSLYRTWLDYFKKQFKSGAYFDTPRWDKVCVTTLFTFYWDITIKTIEFAKKICKDPLKNVMVGGVLASVVPQAVKNATGIEPHVGCLNVTKLKGDKPLRTPYRDTVIDALPLDYSILEEVDYRYPATDAYFSYTTRGCVNKCPFCAVPILEPEYQDYIPIKKRIDWTTERFGAQRHLLLLDNNVFASKSFDNIIDEIKESGFGRGQKFTPQDQLEIAIKQLNAGWNDRAYIRMVVRLLNEYVSKLDGEIHDRTYGLLLNHGLLHDYTATKENIIAVYELIKDEYKKKQHKVPIVRFVDFNQGMDARLVTPEKMAKLSEISIRPLRIAFDQWAGRKFYVRSMRLAKENGILQMSNYLLYNFRDKPVELYKRLLINIDLCDALGINIYSFPMKYHPIMDEKWFTNRDYIDQPHWSRKAIRTIQAVLNSTHGKIGRGRTFFFKAFGRSEEEFEELIRMPEAFIIKRWDAELSGQTEKWRQAYAKLNADEKSFADSIIATNEFDPAQWKKEAKAVQDLLSFYLMKREDIPLASEEAKAKAIKEFEESCPKEITVECRKLLEESYW